MISDRKSKRNQSTCAAMKQKRATTSKAIARLAHNKASRATPAGSKAWAKATQASALANVNSSRSEEHTSELQSLMRISYAVFCLKKKKSHLYKKTSII